MLLVRCLFSLFFWVTVAKWSYLELNIVYPQATPYVDALFEQLTPPTHNNWPEVELKKEDSGYVLNFIEKEIDPQQ